MIEADDPKLKFVKLEDAIKPPPGLIEHIKDSWWVVHPEKGVVFWGKLGESPQCNRNESITRSIWKDMYPWAEIIFIPSVFRRIDPNDWVQ